MCKVLGFTFYGFLFRVQGLGLQVSGSGMEIVDVSPVSRRSLPGASGKMGEGPSYNHPCICCSTCVPSSTALTREH